VYLGGPFFTTSQLWMIEEARSGLLSLGANVFSPMHDVGFGPDKFVAAKDLAGLDDCDVMLALLSDADPGTLFEVGYARSKGKPVVALIERPRNQDQTMLVGTDCEVVEDFATALYRVVWAGA
jgi:nucleoside 2-deoxyribosyltransferase